jgi:hypothetical protein
MDEPHAPPPAERRRWLDERRNVDKVYYALIAACCLAAAADLVYPRHGHYEAETLVAAYGIYGFISCVALVLAAKELRKLLKRDEDYYGDDRP